MEANILLMHMSLGYFVVLQPYSSATCAMLPAIGSNLLPSYLCGREEMLCLAKSHSLWYFSPATVQSGMAVLGMQSYHGIRGACFSMDELKKFFEFLCPLVLQKSFIPLKRSPHNRTVYPLRIVVLKISQ